MVVGADGGGERGGLGPAVGAQERGRAVDGVDHVVGGGGVGSPRADRGVAGEGRRFELHGPFGPGRVGTAGHAGRARPAAVALHPPDGRQHRPGEARAAGGGLSLQDLPGDWHSRRAAGRSGRCARPLGGRRRAPSEQGQAAAEEHAEEQQRDQHQSHASHHGRPFVRSERSGRAERSPLSATAARLSSNVSTPPAAGASNSGEWQMCTSIEVTRVRKQWQDRGISYTVLVDDSAVADLRNGRSVALPITPGPRKLQILYRSWRSPTVEFSVGEGQHHRFTCGPRNGLFSSLLWAWIPKKREWIRLTHDNDPPSPGGHDTSPT